MTLPPSGPSELSFWGRKSPFGDQSHLLYQAWSCLPITRFTRTSLPLPGPLSCMGLLRLVPLPSLLPPEASAGPLEHLPPGLALPRWGRQAQSEEIGRDLELNSSIDTCCVWGWDSAPDQGPQGHLGCLVALPHPRPRQSPQLAMNPSKPRLQESA